MIKNEDLTEDIPTKKYFAFGIGQFSDAIALQMFTIYIFTFYFTVVGLHVILITIAFIIWSIWNSINDPLLGALSDRTKTKWGRRKPYILGGIIPLCIVIVLLYTPPIGIPVFSFLYFIVIIILFDTFFTMYDLNYCALFPEMFQDLEQRAKASAIKQVFTVVGLIFAFIIPTLIIPDLTSDKYLFNYMVAAIVMTVFILIGASILIKFGIQERSEFSEDFKTAPPILKSLKFSLKNKNFRIFIVMNLCYWYVVGMLPIITPLYGRFVLGIGEGEAYLLGLLLGIAFLSAAGFMPFWRYVAIKLGMKRGVMLSIITLIVTLAPFLFISNVSTSFFAFFFVGLGISGAIYFGDIILSAIIDQDELEIGTRRDGGYFGINALITKLSTIIVIITIGFVFNTVGWAVFDPVATENIIFGLRSLMFIFPAIALVIGLVAFHRFPITKEKYELLKLDIEKLHAEKREKQRKII
ncbi:MAG: MFS transporter [Candidatus Lokiarchaeota archaeon]|nr:MFS transporter [Candidatus Lokiarchaeota archaeon]